MVRVRALRARDSQRRSAVARGTAAALEHTRKLSDASSDSDCRYSAARDLLVLGCAGAAADCPHNDARDERCRQFVLALAAAAVSRLRVPLAISSHAGVEALEIRKRAHSSRQRSILRLERPALYRSGRVRSRSRSSGCNLLDCLGVASEPLVPDLTFEQKVSVFATVLEFVIGVALTLGAKGVGNSIERLRRAGQQRGASA